MGFLISNVIFLNNLNESQNFSLEIIIMLQKRAISLPDRC